MTNFIYMSTFVSNNCVDVAKFDNFVDLVKKNNVLNIFYGERTARNTKGKCFLVEINSVFYTYTYYLDYGLFETLDDYNNAIKNNFTCPLDYYFSKKYNIENYQNFHDYLLKYNINDKNIKKYEISINESSSYNKEEKYCYEKILKCICDIEELKLKYDFSIDQSIILYIILLNDLNYEINIHKIFEECKSGIKFRGDYENIFSINISKDYYKKLMDKIKIEKTSYCSSYDEKEEFKYEYSIKKFEKIVKELFRKTGLKIKLNYDEIKKNNYW